MNTESILRNLHEVPFILFLPYSFLQILKRSVIKLHYLPFPAHWHFPFLTRPRGALLSTFVNSRHYVANFQQKGNSAATTLFRPLKVIEPNKGWASAGVLMAESSQELTFQVTTSLSYNIQRETTNLGNLENCKLETAELLERYLISAVLTLTSSMQGLTF